MENKNIKPIAAEAVAEKNITPTSTTRIRHTGKEIMKTIKHTAHVAADDAVVVGGEIKAASKELADDVVKDGKKACECTEKAVLKATDKALSAASNVTAKAARAVRKTNTSK
jgi:hypothetical protein